MGGRIEHLPHEPTTGEFLTYRTRDRIRHPGLARMGQQRRNTRRQRIRQEPAARLRLLNPIRHH